MISIYTALEIFNNKTGRWERINFTVPDSDGEMVSINFSFNNGYRALFQETFGYKEHGNAIDEVQSGLPLNASEDVKEAYRNWCGNSTLKVHYINLADLHNYLLKHKKDVSFKEDSCYWLSQLYNVAKAWLTVWTTESWNIYRESNVRIIGWVID